MAKKTKPKQKFIQKLRNKYKLLILNEDTFEEKLTFRLSRMNVFVAFGSLAIVLIFSTTLIIAFTPLREYIPGYPNVEMQRDIYNLALRTDSLQTELLRKDLYLHNIKRVLEGKVVIDIDTVTSNISANRNFEDIKLQRSKEDSLLRLEVEALGKYNLVYTGESVSSAGSISNFFFFSPIKGTLVNGFNKTNKHYGVDIVGKENEPIKATLDGTVILASWTSETGYIIALQHQSNLISVYKHNSFLLKKTGNFVKAGDPIAIIGNTGELTTGPHLHFEIWYNGNAVNPTEYMSFK